MSAPTRAGRALRRSLLKGCVVVIVVAGYSGKRFIYERAQELGIRWAAFFMMSHTIQTPAKGCTLLLTTEGRPGKRINHGRVPELGIRCGAFWPGPCVRHCTRLPRAAHCFWQWRGALQCSSPVNVSLS